MTDETGSTGWTYDDASQVTSISNPGGTIAYTYDAAGRRETMTLPGSKTLTYTYDDAGQLTTVTDWQSRTTSYDYTGFGALHSITRPNGVTTEYEYDDAGRLSAVEHNTVSTMLARYAYDVDPNGNRFAVHITGSAVTTGTEEYEYDDLDRLIEVTYPNGGTVEYDYDANVNRLSVASGGVTTYSYDDADQLTGLSGANSVAYTYDDNGNRLTAGSDTYAYDWRNRLTSVTVGGTTVTYTYAGDDLRSTRTVAGVTTTSLWDRESGLPEVIDDGTTVTVQTGDGVQTSIDRATGTAAYPLLDGLGSVRAQTDGTGAVTATADWDTYGNLRASSGTQGTFGWTGEQQDPATGLTYLRARDDDPLTGRFLQRDTVSPNAPGTQGYNAYAYAANNPATLTDPTGHNVADLIGDAALIGAFVYALRILSAVPQKLGILPPMACKLVSGLVTLGLMLFRQLLALVMIKTIMDASTVFDFMIGRSIGLLQWVRMFKPVKWFFDACARPLAGAGGCKLAARLIPKLPRCAIKGLGEEAVELGIDTALGALGLGSGTSFGKTDAAFFAGGALLNCVGADGASELAFCTANSFDGATKVLMADGTQKPIEAIESGDSVWAADPGTGERGARRVNAVIVGEGLKHLVAITIATAVGFASVTATEGHPFWVDSRSAWVEAGDLAIGDLLKTADDGHVRVVATLEYEEYHRVFNLSIDDIHAFFIISGNQSLLVHNTCLDAEGHHMIPRQILKKLRYEVRRDPRINGGGKEAGHIYAVPYDFHRSTHFANGGVHAYNARWLEELDRIGGARAATADDVLAIRDKLAYEFKLDVFSPWLH
jgi:RHS repeat-associated protein